MDSKRQRASCNIVQSVKVVVWGSFFGQREIFIMRSRNSDWISYLRERVFHTNFSITAPEFLIFW